MTTVHGQLDAALSLDALGAALSSGGLAPEARRSAHFTGGRYLRLRTAEAELSFERASDAEVLVLGDAETHAPVRALAWAASRALSAAGLRHRLELYEEEDDRLAAYLHHGWPTARLWIGHLAADASRAVELAAVAADFGVEVRPERFARAPAPGVGPDGLAALHDRVFAAHDGAVWLLRPDEPGAGLIEREARLAARRAGRGRGVGHLTARGLRVAAGGEAGAGVDGPPEAAAVAILAAALPRLAFARRALLVVEDRFALRDRGLVLAPELPLSALPEGPARSILLGVATPDGRGRVLDARAELPFVSPPRVSGPAWALVLPRVSRDEVPVGSLVWRAEPGDAPTPG